ncbi:right-handed parallel beta-helix repeat-containing protein [Chryseolinea soli]|uniref:DUF11 domain-containing protein n=1 Tax=Chryseolinea soli TaxID=2321403 RepID=A0A385SRV7_9BACT|nr:right-handed parallel beta-helix repeat-containing protein [Chryseolinea soli]AYB33041.1 DUF11 domain-containing protein [Chryseolinea soli]
MSFNLQPPDFQRLGSFLIIKEVRGAVVFKWKFYVFVLLACFVMPVKNWGSVPESLLTGKSFTVNMPGDEEDPNAGGGGDDNKCDVDPNTPGDQCTFRAAIQNHNANRHLDLNTISFNIDTKALGLERVIIKVGSTGLGPLPPVLGAVNIQGLNSGSPPEAEGRIELDGSMAGDNAIGLRLLGGNCHISFFVIHSFSSHGIFIAGTPPPGEGGHRLESNYIGTDVTAKQDKGNGGDGIFIEDTPDNMIGGAGLLRNIISGNEGYGIRILGRDPNVSGSSRSGAPNNRLEGNLIGLDFLEQNVLPNAKGGVLIEDGRDISVGSTQENKGNKIAGVKNGVTIQGSLSQGIKVTGNFIGKDGTGSKFLVGILHRGKLITIEGNLLENIDSIGVDAFLNADGVYNIKANRFEGKMRIGTKLTFGEGRTINIEYLNNYHSENGKGVQFEESVKGNINWNVVGNFANLGATGGSLVIRSNGTKNFSKNTWELHTEAGFRYIAEIEKNVFATVTVTGEVYDRNGLDGVGIKATVKGELAYAFLNTTSKSNGKDGTRLELFGELGGQFTLQANQSKAELNGGAGFRIINGSTRLDLLRAHFEKDLINGNLDGGLFLFDGQLKFSVLENTITNNGPFGIELGGGTQANVKGNTVSGNQVGVNIMDHAEATLTNNTISDNSIAGVFTQQQGVATVNNNTFTANGTGLALAGNGTGSILGNRISENLGLGIDLGNDGITANDAGDADTGTNNLQNFPLLSQVSSNGGNTNIQGSLNSTPHNVFRLEFFSNAKCNASGFGEGETFLGFEQVTTDNAGNAVFSVNFSNTIVPDGAFITATATDSANNTSEFSPCLFFGTIADLELTLQADKTNPTVGEQVTFTITLTNKGPAGATGIAVKDAAPMGLNFDNIAASTGSYNATTGIWTVGALSLGNSATLTILATTLQAGLATNVAEVSASDQGDPDSTPDNGVDSEDDQGFISVEVQEVTGIEQMEPLENVGLYPNPFFISTTITFELVHQSNVQLTIYDEKGMKTGSEFSQLLPAGVHTLRWTPEHLRAGIYFLCIQTDTSSSTSRMLYMK